MQKSGSKMGSQNNHLFIGEPNVKVIKSGPKKGPKAGQEPVKKGQKRVKNGSF